MQKLLERFVPCADEVWYLQNGKGPECDHFRRFCEKGHYGGRTKPTNTRQGTYAAAPSGEFLASTNTNDARAMAEMLKKALAAWEALPREKRLLEKDPAPDVEGRGRPERWYPVDGLVLRVYSRDLPREKAAEGWLAKAWNTDCAWFRKDEAAQFVPEERRVGAKREVPAALVRRIARCHLVDTVRGQSPSFPDEAVAKATLEASITRIESGVVSLRLEGRTRMVQRGTWPIKGFADMNKPTEQERGYETRLLGRASYDLDAKRFVTFELVAAGPRWGGTQYNGRGDDLEPAPMGIVLTLAGSEPADRVAPASVWAYGWK